jgi:hypothetical protein
MEAKLTMEQQMKSLREGSPLSEKELEDWRDGLLECSYDNGDHRKDSSVGPPTRELVGTNTERFLVTKLEINKTIGLIRHCTTVNTEPHSFKVPSHLSQAFMKSKALWALILSIEFGMQQLIRYSDQKLEPLVEDIADIADKLDKLQRFSDIVRTKLHSVKERAGNPDLPDVFQVPKPKPPIPRKPVRHINFGDRKPRETKASKFNLAGLLGKKKPSHDE